VGFGELGQSDIHNSCVYGRHEYPEVAAIFEVDKTVDVEPLVFGVVVSYGPTAPRRPDSTDNWLESNPGFILTPDLNDLVFVPALESGYRIGEPFLKAACSAA
jgi:hypothetical protein